MRALLFNAKNYRVEFDSLANKPKNIVHEEVKGKEKQECQDCVVAFITIEKGDKEEVVVNGISHEIQKMCKEVKRNKAVIVPFAHLSNNLAEPKIGLKIFKEIELSLKNKIEVISTHFGSNKSLFEKIEICRR